jgi:hypothetical protein
MTLAADKKNGTLRLIFGELPANLGMPVPSRKRQTIPVNESIYLAKESNFLVPLIFEKTGNYPQKRHESHIPINLSHMYL